jgi:hypothetical protein
MSPEWPRGTASLAALEVTAPDLIRPVIGFRQWRLTDEGLISLFIDQRWDGPQLTAACRAAGHPGHAAPAGECSCGVYAWYAPCPLTSSVGEFVAGAVVLWGALELHATGMRGQYARVVALALPVSRRTKRRRLMTVAERFGVPAVPHRALKPVALAHGAPLPPSLRPPPVSAVPGRRPIGLVPNVPQEEGL